MPSLLQILVSMVNILTICYGEYTVLRDRCFTQPGDILFGMIVGDSWLCLNGSTRVDRDNVENIEAFIEWIETTWRT